MIVDNMVQKDRRFVKCNVEGFDSWSFAKAAGYVTAQLGGNSMGSIQLSSGGVEKRSLDRAAADALRRSIVEGSLAPGSRLTETQIAAQLNLSRGTIRAALHRLVAEGLVSQRPYAGWEVVRLTSRDAWELYTLRSSLEGLASRLAAVNPDRHRTIEQAFSKLKSAAARNKQKEIADADIGLHKTIVMLSGHKRLAAQYSLIEQQVKMYMASSNAILERPDSVISNHEMIVNAILKGNVTSAERYAKEHNEKSGKLLVCYLKRQENTNH